MKVSVTWKSFGNDGKHRGWITSRWCADVTDASLSDRATIPLEITDCRREIIGGSFLRGEERKKKKKKEKRNAWPASVGGRKRDPGIKGKTAYSRGLPLSETAFTSNERQLRNLETQRCNACYWFSRFVPRCSCPRAKPIRAISRLFGREISENVQLILPEGREFTYLWTNVRDLSKKNEKFSTINLRFR